jgi:hypothetical protein
MTQQSNDPTVYHGRNITEIGENDAGEHYVELEGGVQIVTFDQSKTPPALLQPGMKFGGTRLSAKATTLIFNPGATQVLWHLNPLKYAIVDEREGRIVQQIADATPPHPDERVPSEPAIHDEEQIEPVTDMGDFEERLADDKE